MGRDSQRSRTLNELAPMQVTRTDGPTKVEVDYDRMRNEGLLDSKWRIQNSTERRHQYGDRGATSGHCLYFDKRKLFCDAAHFQNPIFSQDDSQLFLDSNPGNSIGKPRSKRALLFLENGALQKRVYLNSIYPIATSKAVGRIAAIYVTPNIDHFELSVGVWNFSGEQLWETQFPNSAAANIYAGKIQFSSDGQRILVQFEGKGRFLRRSTIFILDSRGNIEKGISPGRRFSISPGNRWVLLYNGRSFRIYNFEKKRVTNRIEFHPFTKGKNLRPNERIGYKFLAISPNSQGFLFSKQNRISGVKRVYFADLQKNILYNATPPTSFDTHAKVKFLSENEFETSHDHTTQRFKLIRQ